MVSVIITCYKEGLELRRAVESVLRQTYSDYEIIVVKDFSDDEPTLEVCKKLEAEGIKVLYTEQNVGVSVTRNMGIAAAKGDIIYTVDGDDELPDDALEIVVNTFAEHPEAGVVFGNYELIENGKRRIVDCSSLVEDDNWLRIDKYFSGGIFPVGQNATRKKTAIQYPSDARYSFGCQDYEMQVRMLAGGVKFVYTSKVVYRWYRKPSGINSSIRNAESYDDCIFEHRDFVAPYMDHKYLLQLCKQNNDVASFRKFFRLYAPNWCKIFSIFPFPILKHFMRFVK